MSAIRDEAERQFVRLAKQFTPIPPKADREEIYDMLCEAGTVAKVAAVGDRLIKGFPHDKDGLARTYFPNTAHIAAVIESVLADDLARAGAVRDWNSSTPSNCPCRGTGFISTEDAEGRFFARRCSCRATA